MPSHNPSCLKEDYGHYHKSGNNVLSQSSQQADKVDIPGEPLQRDELDSEKMWYDLFTILSSSL